MSSSHGNASRPRELSRKADSSGWPRTPQMDELEARVLLSSAPTVFHSVGVGGMGSMYSPSISPYNSNEAYLSSDMTDLYHTTDFGASWNMASFTNVEATKRSKVQFTSNANILYLFIGNGATGGSYLGKSTDSGATWSLLPETDFGGPFGANSPQQIFADPNSTQNIWVSGGTKLWFSNQGGAAGSYRQIASVASGYMYVAGVFTQGTNMYVSTTAGLMVSSDSGATWSTDTHTGLPATVNGNAVSVYSFTGAYQNGVTRFWALMEPTSLCVPWQVGWDSNYKSFAGIYKIDYGAGATWTNQTANLPSGAYPTFLGATPTNTSIVYAAGGDPNGNPAIYKSTNGGSTWLLNMNVNGNANVMTGPVGSGGDEGWGYVADAFGFAVSPTDPNRAIMTDEGGAYSTTDGGATWKCITVDPADLNPAGQNTPTGKPYHSTINPTTSYRMAWTSPTSMYTAFTDLGGIRSFDGGTTWAFAGRGNAFAAAYDPRTGILYSGSGRWHDLYFNTTWDVTNAGGEIDYSLDGGLTWHLMGKPGASTDGANGDEVMDVVVDPNVSNRLWALVSTRNNLNGYTVESGIYVANNIDPNNPASATWTQMNVPTSNSGNAGGHPLDLHILDDGTVVVSFTNFSGVSSPAGVFSGTYNPVSNTISWNADTNNSVMRSLTNDVIIDPQDPNQNTWYACVGGYSGGGVFKTTDRGAHWTQFWQAADGTVNTLNPGTWNGAFSAAINPQTHEMYIASQYQGLWYSSNANAASPTFSFVSAYPYSSPSRVYFDPFDTTQVWVTSFGGGLMYGVSNTPQPPAPSAPTGVVTAIANNGTAIQVSWNLASGATGYTVARTNGVLNASGVLTWTTLATLGSSATTFTDTTPLAGTPYYYRVTATNSNGSNPAVPVAGVLLPAPTGLVAIGLAQGQVDLAWSYNSHNNSGFHIQYSSDGINWSSPITVGQSVRTDSVTGLAADTQYTFRISAANVSGDSSYSTAVGRTFMAGGLLAYDGFYYPVGALNGDNGGSGFASPWSESTGNARVVTSSLTPPAPANTLLTYGNSMTITHDWEATRNTTTTFGTNGSIVWASMLLNTMSNGGSFQIGSMYITGTVGGNWGMHTNGNWFNSSTAVLANTTYLVVIKADTETSGDTFQMWLNPVPGATEPGVSAAIMNLNMGTGTISPSNTIGMLSPDPWSQTDAFDEVRLGRSYADVAPTPVPSTPTGLTAGATSASSIHLAWTDAGGINEQGFHVERSTDQANWTLVRTQTGTTWDDTALTSGLTYYYRVCAYNSTGNSVSSNVAFATTQTPAPTVQAVIINGGNSTRSFIQQLAVQFSKDVIFGSGVLSLHNDTIGQDVSIAGSNFSYSGTTQTGTWDLSAVNLPDGNYTATLHAAVISDASGNLLNGGTDQVFNFFRLRGDVTGDRTVGGNDYAIWLNNFGTVTASDFDGDNLMGGSDYAVWLNNFGQTLPAGGGSQPLADAAPLLSSGVTEFGVLASTPMAISSGSGIYSVASPAAGAYITMLSPLTTLPSSVPAGFGPRSEANRPRVRGKHLLHSPGSAPVQSGQTGVMDPVSNEVLGDILASDRASWVSGNLLYVDGGYASR